MIIFIIACLDRKEVTRRQILKIQEFCASIKHQIILCDSGSIDGTPGLVKDFDNVQCINLTSDYWWTEAIHAGIKSVVDYDLICVLNDDNEIARFTNIDKNIKKDTIYSAKQITVGGKEFFGFRIGFFSNLKPVHRCGPIDSSNGSCFWFHAELRDYVLDALEFYNAPHVGGDLIMFNILKKNGLEIICSDKVYIKQTNVTNYTKRVSMRNFWKSEVSPYNVKMRLRMAQTQVNHYKLLGYSYQTLLYAIEVLKFLLKKLLWK
jgi:glycosyltransferase involved in cell wall biosynthesis